MPPILNSRLPCSICGAGRTVHEAARGTVCSALACQTALIKQQNAAETQAFEQTCESIAATFTGRNVPSDTLSARVPHLGSTLAKTPEPKKRAFRESLRQALRDTATTLNATETPAQETGIVSPALDAGCIACRGLCCRHGDSHAFLTPEYLPALLKRRPADSPATLYREYLRHIPEQTIENSCIFHGEFGCALPRDKRSDVCNSFECDDRLRLKGALAEREDASVLVIAMDGDSVKAAVIAAPGKPLDWIET